MRLSCRNWRPETLRAETRLASTDEIWRSFTNGCRSGRRSARASRIFATDVISSWATHPSNPGVWSDEFAASGGRLGRAAVRVAIVAAVVLLGGSWNAPAGAIEFVTLRVSCNYIGDNVVLIPSSQNRLHVVIGDREQKVIRTCAPGRAGKCRLWLIHRFDLLCGEKKVSWRSIAERLLNLTPMPARMGNTSNRAPLETWELRTLRAESGFAPVDELGGRILSFADKSTPQPPALRHPSDMNAALAAEIAIRALLSPKFEPARVASRVELRKGADATQLFQSDTDLPKSAALISQQPGMPSTSIGPTIVKDRPVTAPDAPLQPIEEVAANISV